jgi:hypothetical protein
MEVEAGVIRRLASRFIFRLAMLAGSAVARPDPSLAKAAHSG